MEKIYSRLVCDYERLRDESKDAVCKRMKELGHIRFISERNFPFIDMDGDFVSSDLVELRYEADGDVTALSKYGLQFSVQYDGTVDACLELLYYLEEGAFETIEE